MPELSPAQQHCGQFDHMCLQGGQVPRKGPGQDVVSACGISRQHERELSQLHPPGSTCTLLYEHFRHNWVNVSTVCCWTWAGRSSDRSICIQLDHQRSWGTRRCTTITLDVMLSCGSPTACTCGSPYGRSLADMHRRCLMQTHAGTLVVGRMFSHDFDINTRSWYCFANIIASLAAVVEVCLPWHPRSTLRHDSFGPRQWRLVHASATASLLMRSQISQDLSWFSQDPARLHDLQVHRKLGGLAVYRLSP